MEPRTPTHLTTLRQLLAHRGTELRAEVQRARAPDRIEDSASDVKDFKDDAEAMQRLQTDDFQLERDLTELRDIEAALQRLDAGTYGDCAECGEAIPLDRLLSHPSASRCAPCQARQEQRR